MCGRCSGAKVLGDLLVKRVQQDWTWCCQRILLVLLAVFFMRRCVQCAGSFDDGRNGSYNEQTSDSRLDRLNGAACAES